MSFWRWSLKYYLWNLIPIVRLFRRDVEVPLYYIDLTDNTLKLRHGGTWVIKWVEFTGP